MNQTPAGERIHIGIFGSCNAGKSSVLNALTGQQLAVVSPVEGTTTDPVYKTMELLPLGPVIFMDTPGLDDESILARQRLEKTRQVLRKTELALVVLDLTRENYDREAELLEEIQKRGLPCLLVWNKSDALGREAQEARQRGEERLARRKNGEAGAELPPGVTVSARTGSGIRELKEALGQLKPAERGIPLCRDLFQAGDTVVLVIPLDKAAPKGRLILPQQQVIRDILEGRGIPVLTSVEQLPEALGRLKEPPALVITDSQAFGRVDELAPEPLLLTSFSILFARYKGNFRQQLMGTAALAGLVSGDQVLVAEGCTHHRQCGDIGTEKLPAWIRRSTGTDPRFCFFSGTEFPENLRDYKVILHCGGCMLNQAEMKYRLSRAEEAGVPMSNYGLAIAWLKGILPRALKPFPQMRRLWLEQTGAAGGEL